MVCIYCHSSTRVYNSRHQLKYNNIWRRRKCRRCGGIFTTIEQVDDNSLVIKTKDNLLHPFSSDELFLRIYDSCRHRKNAVTDARALTNTILGKIRTQIRHSVVLEDSLFDITAKILKRFDSTAYIYYRAYYKETKN